MVACTRAATLHAQRTGVPQKQHPAPCQLQCISKFTLGGFSGLCVDSLILDLLVQGCPYLRMVRLQALTIKEAPSAVPQRTCTRLEQLDLVHVKGHNCSSFKQQLLNLPSLTSLCLGSEQAKEFQKGGLFRAAIDRYSSQLRSLSAVDEKLAMTSPPWSPGTQFPNLHKLDLFDVRIESDEDLLQLMQAAPNVTHISLQFIIGLQTSFAQVPCSWQSLSLNWVYVAELAMLPLSSCKHLDCRRMMSTRYSVELELTPEQVAAGVAAGVAAAQAAGGLHFYKEIEVGLHINHLPFIPIAAPLLKRLTETAIVLFNSRNPEDDDPCQTFYPLLDAVGPHLKCKLVEVPAFSLPVWCDNMGALAQLPQLLPHVQGFGIEQVGTADKQRLVAMIQAATRPFTLHLPEHTPRFVKSKLRKAVHKAGQQLVTLEFTYARMY